MFRIPKTSFHSGWCGFKITRTSERQQREGSTFMYHTMILNLSSPIGPPIF
jgi:hypothetical protein